MQFGLHDRRKGRQLKPDGTYTRCSARASRATRSQRGFYDFLKERWRKTDETRPARKIQVIRDQGE